MIEIILKTVNKHRKCVVVDIQAFRLNLGGTDLLNKLCANEMLVKSLLINLIKDI